MNNLLSEQHFTLIPNILINETATGQLSPLDVLVYHVLRSRLGTHQYVFVGNKSLAKTLGKGVSTIGKSLRRLEARGHIRRIQPDFNKAANTYFPTTVMAGGIVRIGKPPEQIDPFPIEGVPLPEQAPPVEGVPPVRVPTPAKLLPPLEGLDTLEGLITINQLDTTEMLDSGTRGVEEELPF